MADETYRTRRTFYFELWRAGAAGVLETAGTTFLLLIAVRWFEAGSLPKAIVAASGSVGLLVSPLVVYGVTVAGWTTARAAAGILALGALSFLLSAAWLRLPVFAACSMLGMASSSAIIPLLTQIYQENYPVSARGRLFSRTVMVRIAVSALFAKLAGDFLTHDFQHFRWLLMVFAGTLALAGGCLSRCPSRPIRPDQTGHPWRAWRYVLQDRLFRRVLVSWMLLGFGNLMMLPLRVEYLANPRYNLALSAARIALLTSIIPNLSRLALNPLWGYLFDRINFFLLRSILNLGFALGILTFFLNDTLPGLVLAALVFGVSSAGGDVAWSLWVTKFAPPDRVADYMSVHAFLTGVRGVLAPACAFYFSNHFPLAILAIFCSTLILLATLLLILEMKPGWKSRTRRAVVEEISD